VKGGFAAAKAAGGLKALTGTGAKGILAGTRRNALNAAKGLRQSVKGIGGAFRAFGAKLAAGGSGPWAARATDYVEGAATVVAQSSAVSCGPATGEMLTHGAVSQDELLRILPMAKKGVDPSALADGLSRATQQTWIQTIGREGVKNDEVATLLHFAQDDRVGIVLIDSGNLHVVAAEGLDNGMIRILDPWPPGVGSSYSLHASDLDGRIHSLLVQLK